MAEGVRLSTLSREIGANFAAAMTSVGTGFEFQWTALAVAAGAKVYARATLGAKALILSGREIATSQDKAWYRAYVGVPAGTPGAAISVVKTRADSTLETTVTGVFETATNPAGFTPVAEEPAFGGGAGASASGGRASDEVLRIYPPGVVFTLEMENASNAVADMHLHLYWWEVSPDFLPPILDV